MMTALIAMSLYSLTMSITPGPVNLVCFSTGVNFGMRRSLMFVSGATLGFTLLLFLIGISMGQIISSGQQDFLLWLGLGGAAFMAWLGWKIATAEVSLEVQDQPPPGFAAGFLLQWLNPKAWLACIAGVSAFGLVHNWQGLVGFVAIYFVICFLGVGAWACLGAFASRRIRSDRQLRLLNRCMGAILGALALYLAGTALYG